MPWRLLEIEMGLPYGSLARPSVSLESPVLPPGGHAGMTKVTHPLGDARPPRGPAGAPETTTTCGPKEGPMVRLPDDSPFRREPEPPPGTLQIFVVDPVTGLRTLASVFEMLDAAFGGLTEACERLCRQHQEQRLARMQKLQAQQARRRRKRRARK